MAWEAIIQNLLAKADLLIVFLGMLALAWRSLSIAHDLAQRALQQGAGAAPTPTPASVLKSILPTPAAPAAPAPHPPAPDDIVTPGFVNYLKKIEGFSPKAYWDYKQYSIGYGTKAASASEVIDEAEATRRLHDEIAKAYKLVNDFVPNLPKGQAQALTDLTYNAGPGWERGSLGNAVKAQKIDTIKADILLYNHAGGVVNDGLTRRRHDEVSWFDNPL